MTRLIMEGDRHEGILLRLEDCLVGLRREVDDNSIDVVITSPPYNIGVEYSTYFDSRPRKEYLAWLEEVGIEIKRVLQKDGSFFLNVGGKPSDPWIPFDIIQRLRRHFVLQNVIHWVKSIAISKENATNQPGLLKSNITFGHYKPIGSHRFLNDCQEYIFHLTKSGQVKLDRLAIGVPYQDKSNIGRWKAARRDKRCRGNTWFIPYDTIQSRQKERPHPSTFPVKLPEMCILLHGLDRTRLVLDPFMGIGSTALACIKLGVSCLGFEIDPTYYEVSVARTKEVLGSSPLLRKERAEPPR